MKNNPEATQSVFTEWLASWRIYLRNLPVPDDIDFSDYDYQDFLIKANEPQLNRLLSDVAFSDSLAAAYIELHATRGLTEAQNATRRFLADACFMCNPRLNVAPLEKVKSHPGDAAKELLALKMAALRLAKQIEEIAPAPTGPDSYTYLEQRLQAGNPVGYILNRKNSWRAAIHQQPSRRLTELLRCFASDIEEEAALHRIAIDGRRQKGGKQAGLHFAMDGLTKASISLSTCTPARPNFGLVNSVIAALIDPPDGFDPSTARKRYLAAARRKTRV